ncbi:MAG TPA: protein phosphatase 2C domain-containing protein [Spirochaetales bacterium]|nr:serine/threonine-protein phosphatase [Spirochaetales bacterium]HOV38171.1 protein phosphatase 2C domain-containing protein [Spirochaetales bacterium]
MKAEVHAVSHVGYRRERNEDYVFTGIRSLRDDEAVDEIEIMPDRVLFFAVADGLGGEAAGEVASETAVQVFSEGLATLAPHATPGEVEQRFKGLTARTQKVLEEMGRKDPSLSGLGTTLTGVLLLQGVWYWVHVGDTRLYRFQDGNLIQISRDHTLRELYHSSIIPPNILSNCFGGGTEAVYCDFGVLPSIKAERDAILITSDGLHDHVSHTIIEEILQNNPENPLPQLLQAGLDAGGVDNISCLYIKVRDE